MHKITPAIILVGLVFASPTAAKTVTHHRRARPVHHSKHRHPRRYEPLTTGRLGSSHVTVRPSSEAPTITPANPPAPPQMIGVGNPPGCLNGADPTAYLRKYGAAVLRIILSPYYGAAGTNGEAVPCLKAATAAGARVEITIQWRSVWSPAQAADFVRKQVGLYAPYVWAVGLGNEQDLTWGLPGQPSDAAQTPEQYATDFRAASQIVATVAPSAVRVAVEAAPWSLSFSQQALADGLPGAQALAVHAYAMPAASDPTVRDFHNLAASYGMPLWCTEGLDGPGAWVNPRFPPQPSARLAGCQLAVAWLN